LERRAYIDSFSSGRSRLRVGTTLDHNAASKENNGDPRCAANSVIAVAERGIMAVAVPIEN